MKDWSTGAYLGDDYYPEPYVFDDKTICPIRCCSVDVRSLTETNWKLSIN